jgi:CBS domain-containing protein
MTPDPECATVDMPILDALRIMQERKFLHLPVMDRGKLSTYCLSEQPSYCGVYWITLYEKLVDNLVCCGGKNN